MTLVVPESVVPTSEPLPRPMALAVFVIVELPSVSDPVHFGTRLLVPDPDGFAARAKTSEQRRTAAAMKGFINLDYTQAARSGSHWNKGPPPEGKLSAGSVGSSGVG